MIASTIEKGLATTQIFTTTATSFSPPRSQSRRNTSSLDVPSTRTFTAQRGNRHCYRRPPAPLVSYRSNVIALGMCVCRPPPACVQLLGCTCPITTRSSASSASSWAQLLPLLCAPVKRASSSGRACPTGAASSMRARVAYSRLALDSHFRLFEPAEVEGGWGTTVLLL